MIQKNSISPEQEKNFSTYTLVTSFVFEQNLKFEKKTIYGLLNLTRISIILLNSIYFNFSKINCMSFFLTTVEIFVTLIDRLKMFNSH